MAGSLVPIGNTLLVLVSPPVTKCWRIQYRLGGTGWETGTNRGFPTDTKARFSSIVCTPPHLQSLLFCSISFVVADFVLELLLNNEYYGLWLEARVVNDMRIHVVSNKSSSKIEVVWVQLLKQASMLHQSTNFPIILPLPFKSVNLERAISLNTTNFIYVRTQ